MPLAAFGAHATRHQRPLTRAPRRARARPALPLAPLPLLTCCSKFYMRKVKFTQQTLHDKLTQILTDFPVLDVRLAPVCAHMSSFSRLQEIHPFYADLMNVLYDKDHYKLALSQLSTARHLIDHVAKDYVRLLKFGDSLYRCKQLKRSALGRCVCFILAVSAHASRDIV